MRITTRQNRFGLLYSLAEINSTHTRISHKEKSIVVKASLVQMELAWYQWADQGKMIQDAFSFLDADEREFLMTAMTPAEWDDLIETEAKRFFPDGD